MPVLRLSNTNLTPIYALLKRYEIELIHAQNNAPIPGSFWGDEEAGLIENRLYARDDTPIHSILHEGCHYICMDQNRRKALETNAGGDYDEENAVCYLQILLAGEIPDMGVDRMLADMDAWGYSFRLGSARAWFEQDALDAYKQLIQWKIINNNGSISWQLRA